MGFLCTESDSPNFTIQIVCPVQIVCSCYDLFIDPLADTFMAKTKNDVCGSSETDCSYDKRRAVADTLSLIGDKWTVLVVAALSYNGVMRYNEINRQIEGISQRMLTLTLKGLEQNGLVTRTMYSTIPPRVEYALTDLGLKLVVPLRALYDWAEEYRPMLLAARDAFDEREKIDAPRRAEFYATK